jgi:Ca2+-binding RTX toxin-like protein
MAAQDAIRSFEKFSDPITVSLATGSFTLPNGDIQTFLSFENVLGGSGRDSITGDARANGLDGGVGKETITAGAGDDTLNGGAGGDRLNGETGHDHFVYLALADSGITVATRDTITTFGDGEDEIDVSAIDAKAGVSGNQAFTFDNTFGKGDIRATQSGADTLIEFNIDNDAAAETSILLTGFTAINITGADFIA